MKRAAARAAARCRAKVTPAQGIVRFVPHLFLIAVANA